MTSNAVVIVLCALTLGATCYLAVSTPRGGDAGAGRDVSRITELEQKLAAAEKRADAVEALRGEVRQLREKMERAPRRAESSLADLADIGAAARAIREAADRPTDAAGDASAQRPEDLVADRIEKKLGERMEAIAARDQERGEDGKWKAPLEDLAKELTLTEAQQAETKRVFDRSRDGAFALLKTMRLDGGSLLDDYTAALKSGNDVAETTRNLFKRILTEKIPGTDATYLAGFIDLTEEVEEGLGRQLDAGQVRRLKALRVDLLDVKTGYDPVDDYVRARLQ